MDDPIEYNRKRSIRRLTAMIELCEARARQPIDNLVDYPGNSFNNEQIQRAANFAILAEEYRRQLEAILKH